MSDAVVIISSDTSYLEDRTKALGYDIYPIDEYNHKNINKISKISYLKSLIKNISTKHKKIYLIYGSGLEDKVHIYDILDANLIINCNTLELLRKSGDLSLLKDIIRDCDFQLPDENPINYSEKRLLSKPLHSFGGYNISFSAAKRKAFYNQQYIPGSTFSASFFLNDENFMFLGFNKLILLRNYSPHPFIHAGAIMYDGIKISTRIIRAIERLSKKLNMRGYNTIDFKIYNNEVFLLDINPRITSTFKIYNDIYNNNLLNHQIKPHNINYLGKIDKTNKYGFVNIFVKEKCKYDKDVSDDNAFVCLPKINQIIEKDEPLLSIYIKAETSNELLIKLKEKISITTNLYNCYDIDI